MDQCTPKDLFFVWINVDVILILKTVLERRDYFVHVVIYQLEQNLDQKQKVSGYIDKKIIFTGYSGAIMNSWAILNHYIKKEREDRETPFLKLYFLQLYRDAKEFMECNSLPVPKFEKLAREKNLIVLE